jgi:uncharacterized protein YqeY
VITRVQAEVTAAMRAGDRARLDALRLVLAALQRAQKDHPAGGFDDAAAQTVLRRERKQRLEAAESYRAAGRPDRAEAEEAEVPVIEEFLPADLTPAELEALVDAAIAETGAAAMTDMGKVMGLVTRRSGGRADGRAASALVRARLGG